MNQEAHNDAFDESKMGNRSDGGRGAGVDIVVTNSEQRTHARAITNLTIWMPVF